MRNRKLDLVRRAKLLGVTKGHLSRVIAGKREGRGLLLRLEKLLTAELGKIHQQKTHE